VSGRGFGEGEWLAGQPQEGDLGEDVCLNTVTHVVSVIIEGEDAE